MKIYILCDMEGISGIRRQEQVQAEHPEYAEGRVLMAGDMDAAVEGAFAGGATQVVLNDCHGSGKNVRMGDLKQPVILESPAGGNLIMPSLDASFAGVILLGHHARAGTVNGFLDHTMNSMAWFEYRLNDVVVGEIGIEAAWAGHFGVPVIMVSGDQVTADEAVQTLGTVETAVVKRGLGRQSASCLPLVEARKIIRDTTERAVRNARSFKPFTPKVPGTIQITYYRSDMADATARQPGVERLDARTVRRQITSLLDVNRW